MSFDNVSAEDLSGTDTTVVRTLRSWETSLWPAVWPSVNAEKSVLLFQTEPEFVLCVLGHEDIGVVAEVVGVWCAVGHPCLAHDENVVTKTEWVRVHGDWTEVDIGVVAWSLASGRSVEIPFWEVLHRLWDLLQGLER